MIVLSTPARMALDRAQSAYKAAQEAKGTKALNKAENRFYAAAEALFHVLNTDQSTD